MFPYVHGPFHGRCERDMCTVAPRPAGCRAPSASPPFGLRVASNSLRGACRNYYMPLIVRPEAEERSGLARRLSKAGEPPTQVHAQCSYSAKFVLSPPPGVGRYHPPVMHRCTASIHHHRPSPVRLSQLSPPSQGVPLFTANVPTWYLPTPQFLVQAASNRLTPR